MNVNIDNRHNIAILSNQQQHRSGFASRYLQSTPLEVTRGMCRMGPQNGNAYREKMDTLLISIFMKRYPTSFE